jgi:hypothetical protein
MAKSVRQRAREVFENSPHSESKDYADLLLSAWKDLAGLISKQATLLLLIMAIFELLAYQSASSEVTIGSFTLSNTTTLLMALPPLVSFLAYDIYFLVRRVNDIAAVYGVVYRSLWPNQAENDLQRLIAPVLPGFLRTSSFVSSESELRSERFLSSLNAAMMIGTVVIFPAAFQVQAYYILFKRFGSTNVFLWITSVVSFGLIFSACAYEYLYVLGIPSERAKTSDQHKQELPPTSPPRPT